MPSWPKGADWPPLALIKQRYGQKVQQADDCKDKERERKKKKERLYLYEY